MRINEIFYSLQGEGFLAGVPSVFIRLAGCPLRCRWCDTKYAWDQEAGFHYSTDKIIQAVQQQARSKFVIITGGEPMINPDLPQLVQKLKAAEKHITIETAGIAFIPDLACNLMSISPKLNNSTPTAEIESLAPTPVVGAPDTEVRRQKFLRLDITILRKLLDNYKYQLKFVVESQDDLTEIQQTVEEIGNVDSEKVMLMPQAKTREELLAKSPMVAEMCRRSGFAFCQRLHLLLRNNQSRPI